MKRSSVLVAVALAVALAGCAGDDDRDDARTPTPKGPVALAHPLRFVPVEAVSAEPCPPGAAPPALTDDRTGGCLTPGEAGGMTVVRTEHAEAINDVTNGNGWTVRVTLVDEDAQRFADLTAKAARNPPPRNQIAIVQGDRLLSAPQVVSAITGGEVDISGGSTREQAEELARALGAPAQPSGGSPSRS
ncbi:SecDF P1 head subdomain-containing protein [Wenjunlia vitaminophila]|uniref:SecDF P1 head subdomain-containing protein n=1 Tax=Wenjunlia vitaminophila TaxID=76728 RepID=UPI00131A4446|nr:hypothetical protein [Wenjunlia vitaminophila]